MTKSDVLIEIQNELNDRSSEEAREGFAKFVPHSQNVYGVRLPIINDMARTYKNSGFPIVRELWASGAFEECMLAVKILSKTCKSDPDLTLELLDQFKADIDNWAICDTLCSEGIRSIFKIKQTEIWSLATSYLRSDEMWTRRMGIVLLIHFAKIPERKAEVRRVIHPLITDNSHYIKKAVTWITRYLDK